MTITLTVSPVSSDCPYTGYSLDFAESISYTPELWVEALVSSTIPSTNKDMVIAPTSGTSGTYNIVFDATESTNSFTNKDIMTLKVTVLAPCTVTEVDYDSSVNSITYVLGSNANTFTIDFT